MAFDRDVTIDFNADISNYSQSMGQMIQQTQQYSAAADGMIGQIGKMNSVILSGVKVVTNFTQTNKVATAQAAAYQQQLSKIETGAKVTGKSFKELEKTTKSLAKDFPIGMKQATEQVESLQEAGVTTNKEISQLAKTFTKLGAATGTFGPELGKNMLQLNRTFENGTENMEKYADSLTTVTHTYGANAGAVTAFAKSIAPVAATVGMSETSVIGLSTAFSRLGEDGYAAANTFNKVMLDMSKSIREGTPEARIYAEVMGTTAEDLKKKWESNPGEGFISFVEAIKAQGQDGIRSLEQLGLEGVRTQKTIMALANSGNMREIVEEAQSSYGSGSTGKAAETAMSGVNDQLTMLNETMAQTTATAGKPFLSFLEKVLGVANSLSKVISDLVESDVIQGLAKVVGFGGGAFALAKIFTGGGMGMAAIQRFGINPAREFMGGRREGLTDPANAGIARRAGASTLAFIPGSGGGVGGPGIFSRARTGAMSLANMGGNLGALYFRSNAAFMAGEMERAGLTTAQGQSIRRSSEAMGAIAGNREIPWAKRRELLAMEMQHATTKMKDLATMPGGLGRMAQDYGKELKAAGSVWKRAGGVAGRGAVQGLGAIGSMVGLTGAGAAVGGAVGLAAGAGYLYYQGEKKIDEARERGGKDAYRMFNEFAEKAGIATKGLVSFAEAVNESTSAIASVRSTREEMWNITPQERRQAMNPSYEAAYEARGKSFWDKFTNTGGPDIEKEALRIRGMLGPNASPEAINRMQMDLTATHGEQFATAVSDQMKQWEIQGLSNEELQGKFKTAEEKSRVMGVFGGEESAEFAEMAEAERARQQKINIDIKGQSAVQAEEFKGGEAAWEAYKTERSLVSGDEKKRGEHLDQLISTLNLSAEEGEKVRQASYTNLFQDQSTLGEVLRASGLENRAIEYEKNAPAGGYASLSPEEIKALSVSAGETAAAENTKRMSDLGFETGTLATEMAGTAKTIRDSGMTIEDWSEAVDNGTVQATKMEKAWADVKLNPGDIDAQTRLANIAAEKAVAEARKSGTGAQGAREILQTALTTETGEEIPAIKQALGIIEQQAGTIDSGMSAWEKTSQTITTGAKARAALTGPGSETMTSTMREQYEAEAAAGDAALANREQQVRAFQLQQRRQQEDYNKQRLRMNRDYELQMSYQAEDFAKQRKYMIQDYHRSVHRAEEDFRKQRMRAQRDFDKQVKRQSEETAKNMFDPYQRIAPQMVTDIGVLEQSLLEQNASVRDQLSSVKKLSRMGLSKDAIDQLKLMEPGMNQQVQRLLADAQTDPTAVQRINDLITQRLKLGGKQATSEFNKPFQNMKEDFKTGMEDMAEDFEKNMSRGHQDFKRGLSRNADAFETAQSRAATAHQQALDDMAQDNATAQQRAMEDLTGMAQEYTDEYVDVQGKFLNDLASLPGDMAPATKAAIKAVLEAETKAIKEANTKATNSAKANTPAPYAMGSGPGGGGGADLQGVDGPTAGVGHYSGNWRNYRNGGFHGGADIAAPAGTPTYAVVNGRVKYTKALKTSYGIHALVTDGKHDFLYGHMSALHVRPGDKVEPGTQVGKVGSTGNSTGNHLHFEVRPAGAGHTSAINPGPWLAEGGIVTKHIQPHVGEGGPEAVVPLNERGMRFLSDSMAQAARYWNPTQAAGTRSQGYSAPVTNNVYTYDQRTQFMGEVSVQSQDPEEMARKLASRERRNRLARKTGSAA